MIARQILIAILILIIDFGYSQESISNPVVQIEEGILFVRLDDRAREIDYLTSQGKMDEIKVLQNDIAALNMQIIEDFELNYDLGQVCFYYSSDAKALIEDQDLTKVKNCDEGLELDKPWFFALKDGLGYHVSASSKYYKIYRYHNGRLLDIPKPFPPNFKPKLLERIFNKDIPPSEAGYIAYRLDKAKFKF